MNDHGLSDCGFRALAALALLLGALAGCRSEEVPMGSASAGAAVEDGGGTGGNPPNPGGTSGGRGDSGGMPSSSGGSALGGSAGSEASGGSPDIDPAALAGCRASDEPGCDSCFFVDENGTCNMRGAPGFNGNEWIYNYVSVVEGACPAEPRCARCSRYDERKLRMPAPQPSCECSGANDDDPCGAGPDHCACYCAGRDAARAACPPPAGQ